MGESRKRFIHDSQRRTLTRQHPVKRMIADKQNALPPHPSILAFLKDAPNLCSLAGLACSIAAIHFSIAGLYPAAMIGMVWAVAFDWADGLVARRLSGRSARSQAFGGQLDVLIDIVSYGVTPAILLLSYGHYGPVFLLGAFIMLATCALRLSYFSIFGIGEEKKYTGLAMDNNSLIIVFVFLFESMLGSGAFVYVLFLTCLCLAALNVSTLKTPKLSGKLINVYLLAAYTLSMSAIYGFRLFW